MGTYHTGKGECFTKFTPYCFMKYCRMKQDEVPRSYLVTELLGSLIFLCARFPVRLHVLQGRKV